MIGIIIIAFSLFFSAFFSGSETGLITCNRIRVQISADKGSAAAKTLLRLLNNQEKTIVFILIGNNIANVTGAAVATAFLFRWLSFNPLQTTLIMTPLFLIFGEILPKALFVSNPEKLAMTVALPLEMISYILKPLTELFSYLTKILHKTFRRSARQGPTTLTKEELKMMVEMSKRNSDIPDDERLIVTRLFEFTEKVVREAMIPLVNVTALSLESSTVDVVRSMKRTGYSRIPVYRDRIDNMIGIVNADDLLISSETQKDISDLIRKAPYVPELQEVDRALTDFQKQGASFAFVVDEYGAVSGIITIEDLLEEVLGEIHDEYDPPAPSKLKQLQKNMWSADASIEIEALNEALPAKIIKGDYETLAGFLLSLIRRIPAPGEIIHSNPFTFTIIHSDEKRIKKVRILLAPSTERTAP